HDPGEIVTYHKSVIYLLQPGDGGADDKRIKDDVLHALNCRSQGHNAGSSRTGDKTLGSETHSNATYRIANVVAVAHVVQTQFIYGVGVESLGLAQGYKLSPAKVFGAEAGNISATLSRGIGIVERVIVKEIIGGEEPPALVVCVEPESDFVIPQ